MCPEKGETPQGLCRQMLLTSPSPEALQTPASPNSLVSIRGSWGRCRRISHSQASFSTFFFFFFLNRLYLQSRNRRAGIEKNLWTLWEKERVRQIERVTQTYIHSMCTIDSYWEPAVQHRHRDLSLVILDDLDGLPKWL